MDNNLPEKISATEMQQHMATDQLRQQLIDQIVKDLGLESIPVDVNEKSFFNKLQSELTHTLVYFIEKQSQQIPNLIYRVDLNEITVRTMLAKQVDVASGLAELILIREMKKVFYRNVYSGKIKL